MAQSPQTWKMLQAIQWRVQNEVVLTTTTSTPVSAPGTVNITPSDMTGYQVGSVVQVENGTANAENVTVTAVTATTWIGTFTKAHTTTPYNIAVSPFTVWSSATDSGNPGNASDANRFGTNPIATSHGGSITNAIYIGYPKDPKPSYLFQCCISVLDEDAHRLAFGGRIQHETPVYVCMRLRGDQDWYTASQTLINTSDVFHTVLQRHAELPDAPVVQAVKAGGRGSAPTGYFPDHMPQTGYDWWCWGAHWWHKREWTAPGGITS